MPGFEIRLQRGHGRGKAASDGMETPESEVKPGWMTRKSGIDRRRQSARVSEFPCAPVIERDRPSGDDDSCGGKLANDRQLERRTGTA